MTARELVSKRLEELMNTKQLTNQVLSEKSGISVSSIRRIRQGIETPQFMTLNKISEGMGITLSQFFAEEDRYLNLSEVQKNTLEYFNQMSGEQQRMFFDYMEGLLQGNKEKK